MTAFALVHNIPSPYRLYLFRLLHEHLRERGIDFHVHFMAYGHADRPHWRPRAEELSFPHTFWRDIGPTIRHKAWHLNPGMIAELSRSCTDYLLVGGPWDSLTGMLISLLARRRVAIAWLESNTSTPGRITGMIGTVKRTLLGRYDFVTVPGLEGKRQLVLLWGGTSINQQHVFLPNLIDERKFSPGWVPGNRLIREQKRREIGVDDQTRLALWPARLIPEKGIIEFLSILKPSLLTGWRILLLGKGPLEAKIQETIERCGLGSVVQVRSYVPYEEMPTFYQASDLFLLPSMQDPNPLSVVEALHSGLPLLVSKRIGNLPEALEEGSNGWSFDPSDSNDVIRVTSLAFNTSRKQLIAMGQNSVDRARAFWDSHVAIDRFIDVVMGENYSDDPSCH